MSDELKIIAKVELDTDEAKKQLQDDLSSKPVPLDVELDTDKIQSSLETAFSNATKTLGTKIKDAINSVAKDTRFNIGDIISGTSKGSKGSSKISSVFSFDLEKQLIKFDRFSKDALLAATHVEGLYDEIIELKSALNSISSAEGLRDWIKQFSVAKEKVESFKKSIQGQALFKGLELEGYSQNINRMLSFPEIKDGTTSGIVNLRNTLVSLKDEIDLVSQKLKFTSIDDAEYKQLTAVLEGLVTQYRSAASVASKFDGSLKSNQGLEKFNEQAEIAKNKLLQLSDRWSAFRSNPALVNQFRELVALAGDLDPTNLAEFNRKIQEWSSNVKAAGLATQSFGDKVGKIGNFFANWLSLPELISRATQSLKSMAQTVISIDTSMTGLKKVTDATSREYEAFLDRAGKKAVELGSTITDLIDSSSIFARLGYGLDEAAQLGEVASMYHLVGDEVESIDAASKSLVSTMQAFDILPSEAISVIDKLNSAGKLLPEPVVTRCLEEYYIGQSRFGAMCA